MADPRADSEDDFKPYKSMSAGEKFAIAGKQNPAMLVGMGIGSGALVYMLYKLKTTKQKLSVHLIHTRIAVQGSIAGAMTLALFWQIWTNDIKPWYYGTPKPKNARKY